MPLFVSRPRLARRKSLPRAIAPWALDSGGFTQVTQLGGWSVPPWRYAAEVARFDVEIGHLAWAAPQDWMCEDEALRATGLTVEQHQQRTVDNLVALRMLAPELPWVPVLQGVTIGHYLRCAAMYEAAGVDLTREPLVGVGSVCRRQNGVGAALLVDALHRQAGLLRLHGFGVKTDGLRLYGDRLTSVDSLAWSYNATRHAPLPGHTHKHCGNCMTWAMSWRANLLERGVAA